MVRGGADHVLSAFGRQAGIVVGVHSVPRSEVGGRNFSFLGPDRMDNLPKLHDQSERRGALHHAAGRAQLILGPRASEVTA